MTLKQYKFLKMIYRRGVSHSRIEKHFPAYRKDPELCDSSFQTLFYSRDGMFFISVQGKMAYEERRREDFRYRIPLILSVVAIIVSALAIVLSPFFNVFFTKLYGL